MLGVFFQTPKMDTNYKFVQCTVSREEYLKKKKKKKITAFCFFKIIEGKQIKLK